MMAYREGLYAIKIYISFLSCSEIGVVNNIIKAAIQFMISNIMSYGVAKYRYPALHGDIAINPRGLIRQRCTVQGVNILRKSVGKEHAHLLLSRAPSISPSKLMQYLKERSSRLLQGQFLELQKRYWGQHLWARRYFCASIKTVTEEII